MVKGILSASLLLLLFSVFPDEGRAFRCGSGLVTSGDRMGKVLVECGPPTSKEASGGKTQRTSRGKKGRSASDSAAGGGDSGRVERWFYNCGDHDFVYVLTFEGGVLTREETQGYGKGRSDCQGRR